MVRTIIDKYKAVPTAAKAAAWFMVCTVLHKGSQFIITPVLVRLLTPEQYGVYSVFLSWNNIISIFATLNMSYGVFNNAMFRYPDYRNEYSSAAQSISITATIICSAIYFIFSGFFDSLFGLPTEISTAVFVQLLFTEGFLIWSSRQRYEYKYIRLVIATSVFSALYLTIPILVGYITPEELRLSAVVYAGAAVQSVFGLCFTVYNYIKGKRFFNKEYWSFALRFNIPLVPHYLSGIILGQSDRVMINSIAGAAEAGIYSFTYNISLVMNIVTNSINNAIVPYTFDKLKSKDFKDLRTIACFLLILTGFLTILFTLVAPELIMLLATPDYYEAIYLVPVISLSSYFQFLYYFFGNIEFFFEKKLFITTASIVGASANVALNALLIPVFGYFAAGYTTLLCYIILSLVHCVFSRMVCRQKFGRTKVYDYKEMFLISFAAVAVSFALLLIYDMWYVRYLLMLVILAVIIVKRGFIISRLKMIGDK